MVDDGSTDGTADMARRRGPRHRLRRPGRRQGPGHAGRPLATEADLLAFIDGDVTNFGPHFVTGLLGPLLTDDSITVVKGFYQRPLNGAPDGGGRVTELMARPVIDLLFPHLAAIRQPLAGETAAPRCVLRSAPWPTATPWSWPCSSTWPPSSG